MQNNIGNPRKNTLLSLLGPYKLMIFWLVVFTVLSNGLNLAVPKIIASAIDSYAAGNFRMDLVIIEFLVASGAIFFFTYLQSIAQIYASERVARDLRTQLISRISLQDYDYIQVVTPSKLLTNLTSDVDSVKSFVSQAISSIISSVFLILGASVLLLLINWRLALVVLLIIPVIGITFSWILSQVRKLFKTSQETIDWLNRIINESILGSALIRVLNSQAFEYAKFLQANERAKEIGLSILSLFATLIPIIIFTSNIAILIILLLGGHFVISGSMTLGDFSAFNGYLSILIFPIILIGFMSGVIAQAQASYARISEILDAEPPRELGKLARELSGVIEVQDISLKFGEKYTLKNVSFFIEPGTRTAIIGPTAAGRTQLLSILTGLLSPTSGLIKYDGEDIRSYDKTSLYGQVGLVFQDSSLFNLTLRENIAFSNIVKDEDIARAIDTAELRDFIGTLPKGLDTVVSERGTSLSGGQKQRVMLARALAIHPKILFLDDFTARLDVRTEHKILENVRKNYPDITLISVTQKIEAIEDYDRIILLMEGELLAIGTHAELMQSSCILPRNISRSLILNFPLMTTNYQLGHKDATEKKKSVKASLQRLTPLLSGEKRNLIITLAMVLVSSASNLMSPFIIGITIDRYVQSKDYQGILMNSGLLLIIYILGSLASYIQTKIMGGVGRRLLFDIRNAVFYKLQELPIAFFNQNRSGDLISRINNDTDKLNQFISQALMQFIGNFFLIVGTGIFILFLHFELAVVTLLPALGVLVVSQILSPWVKRKNLESLQSTGGVSSEIQESLANFKVVVAFNRLDYFRKKFEDSNERNYRAGIGSGIANNVFIPIYGLASNLASLLALAFGVYLISQDSLTIGLLIGFQFYVTNFYSPLRQLAAVWASFQTALASLDRVGEVMDLSSDMEVIESKHIKQTASILEFKDVSFRYPGGEDILKHINFSLEKGKTYALVGPTGGGKTTTASLMARLYDPTEGTVFLDSEDIRTYSHEERTRKIGFILQEPFLFSGTLRDNILYGNTEYTDCSEEELTEVLRKAELYDFIMKFEGWLSAQIVTSDESISLGQKQVIAFIRAILRDPELLVLDEATANIDTVTEQLLEEILAKLPEKTTKVIIAHRLNTIENADRIFFVNSTFITETLSMEDALDMLLHGKRES